MSAFINFFTGGAVDDANDAVNDAIGTTREDE